MNLQPFSRTTSGHNRIRWLILAGLIATVSGCQSLQSNLSLNGGEPDTLLVRENLIGEECRVQRAASPRFAGLAQREFEIYCGRWEHPSGHILEVVDSAPKSLHDWPDNGWWREALDRRMLCDTRAGTVIFGDVEALILQCKLRNGDWPYAVLVAEVDGTTYLADGIPAILTVLEDGVGIISERLDEQSAVADGSRSAALRKMKTALNLPIYGAGDLNRYYRLMTAGQFYNSIKDFSTAADRYREALAMHERILGVDNPGILDPLMHLALEMSNQGRVAEADLLFDRVGVLTRQTLDRSDRARYSSYKALHAANQRDFDQALDFARQATRLRKEIAQGQPRTSVGSVDTAARRDDTTILAGAETASIVDIIQSLYIESAMLQRLGRVAEAEEALAEAKRILRNAQEMPPSWEPELLGLSARIAKSKGADAERSQYLTTAVSLWQQFAPDERPSVINYLKLGDSNLAEGRKDDAMQAFRQAIALVKERGGSLTYDQLQPFFHAGFERAQARPAERDRLYAEMFEAGQLVRSERTTHTIARAVARLAASEGEAGQLVRDYQEAQDQRLMLYRRFEEAVAQPDTEANRARIEALKNDISEINRRIRDLGSLVQAAHPRYYQLVDSVVDAAQVIDLIKPGEALVQVLLGTNEGILFLVHDGTVRAFALDLSLPEAEDIVWELRTGLEPKADGTLPKFNAPLAHRLYRRLLGPALDDITVDHLITVPTGPLLSLPFGLLVTDPPPKVSGYNYRRVPWLLRRSAISLLPSVHSFVGLRGVADDSSAANAFIGFGDFVPLTAATVEQAGTHLPKECRADPERQENYRRMLLTFQALPLTRFELEQVRNTFAGNRADIVVGADFNDRAVMTLPLSDYRILYFATHGLLPAELECQPQPALLTTLPDQPQGSEDGLIDVDEIVGLRLDADLVVLSACNTGGPGLETGGESLSGLARAFFFAGARSLIVSHWLAENRTTAQMMIQTFKRMRTAPGEGWAGALRSAQLSLIDEAASPQLRARSHPLLWAAFTVVGDGARGVSENGPVPKGTRSAPRSLKK